MVTWSVSTSECSRYESAPRRRPKSSYFFCIALTSLMSHFSDGRDLQYCPMTHQSRPSSIPSPLTAQLPLTLQSRPFSPPANPNCSLISSGFSAPSTSCLLQNTNRGTPTSSSSDSIVNSSDRDVCRREWSEESIT